MLIFAAYYTQNNKHMRKLYTLLFLLAALTAQAQDFLYLGYCGTDISTQPSVKTGTNKDIEAAICLTPDMLAPYVGCEISAVRVGFPDNDQVPAKVVGRLRVDSKTAAPAAESDSTAAVSGWNTIAFRAPYIITGQEKGVYVSFSYHQTTPLRCLSFVGTANDNGGYLGTTTYKPDGSTSVSWANVSKAMQGVLSLRPDVTGSQLPHPDIALLDVAAKQPIVQLGSNILITGRVRNNANAVCAQPVLTFTLNGQSAGSPLQLSETLAYEDEAAFTYPISTAALTEEQTAQIGVSVAFSDQTTDERPANNSVTLGVELAKEVYTRRMVAEEGTGTWCGFCVRGIVGLRKMKAKYGDDHFIGIGVHNADEFVYAPYDSWLGPKASGYPCVFVNRIPPIGDPSFEELEYYYQQMNPIAVAKITATGAYTDATHITAQADVKLGATLTHKLRVAFVVLEDSVWTTQANYYSGGGRGALDGFENMDDHCTIQMNDAARFISAINGDAASEIDGGNKGDTHTYTATLDLSTLKNPIVNIANTSLVALLIDQQTGEVLNGDKLERIALPDAITAPHADAQPHHKAYDLQGREVSRPQRGLYIIGGRKVAVK